MGHVFTHESTHGSFCGGPIVMYSRALLRLAAAASFDWVQCTEHAFSVEPYDAAMMYDDMVTGFCFRLAVGVQCSDEGEEELVRLGSQIHVQDRLSEELVMEASSKTVAIHKVAGDCFEALCDGVPSPAEVCDMAAGF